MTPHRPRIIVAGEFPPPVGGQNIMVRRLFNDLQKAGVYDVEHLRFNFSPTFAALRKFSWHKVLEIPRVWGRMIHLRAQGRVDLLWYPSGGPQTAPVLRDIALLPLLSLLARHVTVHFHAAGIAERLKTRPGLLGRALSWVYRHCVDSAIVMTEFNRCDPEALRLQDISVISHRIEDRNPSASFRPISSAPPHFLYVGHLYDLKGTPQLLRAFSQLISHHPEAHLTLIGGFLGSYTEALCRTQIRKLGFESNVRLVAEIRDGTLDDFYRDADCFVFPSIAPYESFGLVLAEAMMWGLPIVATDWRGNRDVLGDRPGGILFPPARPLESPLANALNQACQCREEWPEWSRRNRQRFVAQFSRTDQNLYEDFISRRVSHPN